MKLLSCLVVIVLLTGCSALKPLNSHFDCPAPRGVACKPLHAIDQQVDGQLLEKPRLAKQQHTVSTNNAPQYFIWLAPREDKKQRYVQGHWVVVT